MIEHPCSNGLSKSCYAAFPKWVKKALAYKFLQVILPNEVKVFIKTDLNEPMVGDGASIPGGVRLPLGSIIPPNLNVPDYWIPWFYMIFKTEQDPRTLFPIDWLPGDQIPREIELVPKYNIPTGWSPVDPPHPVFLPGYNPFKRPPEWKDILTIYIIGFEGGPIHRPYSSPPSVWTQIFSNVYWEPYYHPIDGGDTMSWDGEKWQVLSGGIIECSTWPALLPKTGTTWTVNYRPSQSRITFTGGTAPVSIGLCDTAGNLLGNDTNATSPVTIDLDFSAGNDIGRLNTNESWMYITNIEFK